MTKKEIENCFNYLRENGLLQFGTCIPKEVVEKVLNKKYCDDISYKGHMMKLANFILENGIIAFLTERKPGCIVIPDAFGQLKKAKAKDRNNFKRMKKLESCMRNTPIHEFTDKEYRRHLHISSKISASFYAMNSCLSSV